MSITKEVRSAIWAEKTKQGRLEAGVVVYMDEAFCSKFFLESFEKVKWAKCNSSYGVCSAVLDGAKVYSVKNDCQHANFTIYLI